MKLTSVEILATVKADDILFYLQKNMDNLEH